MDSHGNILKMSFLMSYLALLICLVSGIPFMTCVFRSIILMTVFTLAGYGFRWFLYNMVSGVEPDSAPRMRHEDEEQYSDFDMSDGDSQEQVVEPLITQEQTENVEQASE